jgi:hypothetical protein
MNVFSFDFLQFFKLRDMPFKLRDMPFKLRDMPFKLRNMSFFYVLMFDL